MQPIRQVIDDAPDMIPIPLELRHKRLELIIWPLEESDRADHAAATNLKFRTMRVNQVVMPPRDERYER